MMEVITGGSGSGKSAYAEERACLLGKDRKKFYVATMMPYGEETERKIERHRKCREGKGFCTLEWHCDFAGKLEQCGHFFLKDAVILLECVSNLTANELYEEPNRWERTEEGAEAAVSYIEGEILLLSSLCRHLIVVTNEVFSESVPDSQEMLWYKRVLGLLNQRMAAHADIVTEVVCGIPCTVRGKDIYEGGTNVGTVSELHGKEADGNGMNPDGGRGMDCREERKMWLITGGAFQGKLECAMKMRPGLQWADGEVCGPADIEGCGGIYHFHQFIRRWLQGGRTKEELTDLVLSREDGIVIVTDEIGCGLVPVDEFERYFREETGRICVCLGERAERIYRVVCGVPVRLK